MHIYIYIDCVAALVAYFNPDMNSDPMSADPICPFPMTMIIMMILSITKQT